MDCPFCAIDKEKTRIVKRYKNFFVVLSNPRLVRGHLLVIPKKHFEKLFELNKKLKGELFEILVEFQEKLLRFYFGCDIRQNYRPFLKENKFKVSHLHFHLIPRKFEDKLYKKSQIFEKEIFENLRDKEAKEVINILEDE